jgi:hypothetical protein
MNRKTLKALERHCTAAADIITADVRDTAPDPTPSPDATS